MGGLFGFREFMAIAAGHPNVYLGTSYSLVTVAEEIGLQRLAVYIKHPELTNSCLAAITSWV